MASQDVSSEHTCFRCQILNVSHSTASESLFSFPVVRFYLKTSTVEFQGFSATYLDRATCWPRQETKRRRGGDPWLSDQAAKKKFSLDHPRPKLHKLKFQIHLPLHCALLFQGKKKKKKLPWISDKEPLEKQQHALAKQKRMTSILFPQHSISKGNSRPETCFCNLFLSFLLESKIYRIIYKF